jgi:amino acid adenylation domain-containing protein
MDRAWDIVARFNAKIRQSGQLPAIEFDGRTWSYAELDRASDVVASWIRDRAVLAEHVVVIDCERTPMLVVAVLACVKARTIFFVVGGNQPETYLSRVVEGMKHVIWLAGAGYSDAAKARRVAHERLRDCYLLDNGFLENISGAETSTSIQPPQPIEGASGGDSGMYLVVTSGTTGVPKLVLTTVAPIVNFIDWYQSAFSLSCDDKFSLLSGLGYDPLIRDIFTPLCIGACISIPTKEVLGRRHGLRSWIDEARVTVIHTTPQMAQTIFDSLDQRPFECVRVVATGGAVLTKTQALRIKRRLCQGSLINVYGTSETPQVMTFHVVEEVSGEDSSGFVPIGKPISAVSVEVLNKDGVACELDEIGEIHVTTPYLSLGYYQDPQATRQKFIFSEVKRCMSYRTGDLGFLDGNGDLNYIGRTDRQVKYRGYRVQLEEIERALLKLDGVLAAAVVHETDQEFEKLICYVKCDPGKPRQAVDVRRSLAAVLPAHMLPDSYAVLEEMPLNRSNKIDYAALGNATAVAETKTLRPVTTFGREDTISKELLSIWSEVLGVSTTDIALTRSFFDVGGTSLLSMSLVECINSRFASKLTVTDLFVYSNINDLSEYLACTDDRRAAAGGDFILSRAASRSNRISTERNKRMQRDL